MVLLVEVTRIFDNLVSHLRSVGYKGNIKLVEVPQGGDAYYRINLETTDPSLAMPVEFSDSRVAEMERILYGMNLAFSSSNFEGETLILESKKTVKKNVVLEITL